MDGLVLPNHLQSLFEIKKHHTKVNLCWRTRCRGWVFVFGIGQLGRWKLGVTIKLAIGMTQHTFILLFPPHMNKLCGLNMKENAYQIKIGRAEGCAFCQTSVINCAPMSKLPSSLQCAVVQKLSSNQIHELQPHNSYAFIPSLKSQNYRRNSWHLNRKNIGSYPRREKAAQKRKQQTAVYGKATTRHGRSRAGWAPESSAHNFQASHRPLPRSRQR